MPRPVPPADPVSVLELPDLPELGADVMRLREEVRDFLADERARGTYVPACDAWLRGHDPAFSRRLAERGWIGMTWPRRYGGHERSALERYVVTEELLAAGAPVAAHWGVDRQIGPSILVFGSEDQRQRFLPRFARGECFFSAGMSEPDSGSDLASIRTRAVPVDGGFSLSGRKVWTSHAHRAHFIVVLCRTEGREDDRHAGISQLIVPLDAEGVHVRPIRILTGEHHFNEVLFDEVFVPDDMLLGRLGDGWRQIGAELTLERSGPDRFLSTFPLLAELVRALGDQPSREVRASVGRLVAALWALRRLSLGIASAIDRGDDPAVLAAAVKDLGTRFERQVVEMARLVRHAATHDAERFEVLLAEAVLVLPGFTLRGGTSEILRTIVARGLGVS